MINTPAPAIHTPASAIPRPAFELRLRHQPPLRLELSALQPAWLADLPVAEVERLRLPHGNGTLAVADVFDVTHHADGDAQHLVIAGDLSRGDQLGAGLATGRITVEGDVGDYAGARLGPGAVLDVRGRAGLFAGCELAGGMLRVHHSVGDHAAGARPGSIEGMHGGLFVIGGSAGARLGDRMRRGTVVVHGDAGDFAASRLVAGTLAFAGAVGAHAGHGMRRGSLVFAGRPPTPGPTFVPAPPAAPVAWQLIARDLARHGGAFVALASRRPARWVGDLAVEGFGEWWLADASG